MNRRIDVADAPRIESLSPGVSVLNRVPEFLGELLEQVAHAHPEDPLDVLLRELDLPSPPRRGRGRRALPLTGAARRSPEGFCGGETRRAPGAIPPPGRAQKPASNPPGGRRTRRTVPFRRAKANATGTTGLAVRTRTCGYRWGFPLRNAPQCERRGHFGHRGAVGRHTVAPSSIRAWLYVPGSSGGTRLAAISNSRRRASPRVRSPLRRNTRESTRIAFPSTAGTRSPNAMLATAPAA